MYHGMISVYKEKGFTSHDVVAKLRGILKQKRIGHTGTLDPDAEGVLLVCLGSGTKLVELLTDTDKTYEAVLRLGIRTDTQDMSGKPLCERPVLVTEEDVRRTAFSFLGSYDQIPPMYSAVKVGGKKLYELAREGKTIERTPRTVYLKEIRLLSLDLPHNRVKLSVTCSKGTYIRTLCEDIGERLGCGGCMESLLRVRAGRFTISDSLRLGEIETLAANGRLSEAVLPVDGMFPELSRLLVNGEAQKRLYNGNPIELQTGGASYRDGEQVRMYDSGESFVGIYRWDDEKQLLWPVKMFLDRIR